MLENSEDRRRLCVIKMSFRQTYITLCIINSVGRVPEYASILSYRPKSHKLKERSKKGAGLPMTNDSPVYLGSKDI